MKKHLKYAGSIIFAVALLLGISRTGFAVGTETIYDNTVTLKKSIRIDNKGNYRYEPGITYTYTLRNGEAGGYVERGNSESSQDAYLKVKFRQGLVGYLANGEEAAKNAVFDKDKPVDSNTLAEREMKWTFNPNAFPAPGVYRYIIEETQKTVEPASIGISRNSSYDTSKYLDIYVQNGNGGKVITGYALVDNEDKKVTGSSSKSTGWSVDTSTAGSESSADLEAYRTHDIEIKKQLTGSQADMSARFPFTVTFSGEMSSAHIEVAGTGQNISSWRLQEGSAGATDTATVTGNLGHNETLIIKGLPETVTYTVTEKNSTPDAYKVTSTMDGGPGVLVSSKTLDQSLVVLQNGEIKAEKDYINVKVTNELDAPSLTGLVLRFGPYICLVLLALALLLMPARRRKKA